MTLNDEDMIEGSGCIFLKIGPNATRTIYKTITTITDMAGNLVYLWIMGYKVTQFLDQASGGIQITLGSNSSNYRTWYIGGSDKYRGGWECFCVDPMQAGSIADTGTYNVNSISYIALTFKGSSTAVNKANTMIDYIHYGTGMTVYGGTSGSPATLQDFISYDDTNVLGVLYSYAGIIFQQGKLRLGSTTQSSDTYFKDTSQIIEMINRIVASNYYEIILQGKSGQTTEVYLGSKSGSAGISGFIIKATGTAKYKITATDVNLTKYGFYGCTFINAETITLPSYDVNKEVLNCNFEGCAEVVPDTALIKYSKFISSVSSAITMSSASHNITNCDFISCPRGIHITTALALSYDALKFTGCTYDGYATGGAVTVNYNSACSSSNGWNYDPAGNVITYQTSVTLIVRHVKTGSEPTEYVKCAIYKKSDMTELMNKDATVNDEQNTGYYKASESCTQTGIVVIIRAREKGYYPFEVEMTIPSGGLDVTAVWIEDPNYVP